MIDRLARPLALAFPELNGEQLVDALWLAAKYGESAKPLAHKRDSTGANEGPTGQEYTEDPGTSIGTDLALSDNEQLLTVAHTTPVTEVGLHVSMTVGPLPTTITALSLFRRVHRPGPATVDVDATVEATADAQRLVVVTRASRERGLDVAIVVDRTPVTTVWLNAINDLEATLRRTGAFRSVTRWSLGSTDETGPPDHLVLRDSAGTIHSTNLIVDPAGRRLVLLLTDGVADRWRSPGMWRALARWAQAMPTALVHLLPRSYWGFTATGRPTATVRSRRPASPNLGLEVMSAWWSDDAVHTQVPVPIIEMQQEDLVRWAQAVVTGSTWTDAVWAQEPEDVTTVQATSELTPDDRVRAFRSRASTGAQALARVLAGAPLLSLPLIHVLHKQLLPNPETSQLAEVLVSDLLEKLPDSAGDSLLLRFQPGVADLLYQGTSASPVFRTWE